MLPAKVGYADVRKVKDTPVMLESSSKSGQTNGQGLRVEYSGFGQLDANKYKVVIGIRKEKIGDIIRIDEGLVSFILAQEGEDNTTEAKVIEKSYSKGCKDGVLTAGDAICRVSMVVTTEPGDNVFADRYKDGNLSDKLNNQENGDKEKDHDNKENDFSKGEKFYRVNLDYTFLSSTDTENRGSIDIRESISDIAVDSDHEGKEGVFFIKNISPSKNDVVVSKISRLSQDSYIDYGGTIEGEGAVQDSLKRSADKDEKGVIKSGNHSRFSLKQSNTYCSNVEGGECTDSMIIEFEIGGKRKTAIVDFVVDYSGGTLRLIFSRHKDKIIWGTIGAVATTVFFKYFMGNGNDENRGRKKGWWRWFGSGDGNKPDDGKGPPPLFVVDNRHQTQSNTFIFNVMNPVPTTDAGVNTEPQVIATNTDQQQQPQNNIPQVVTTDAGVNTEPQVIATNTDQQQPHNNIPQVVTREVVVNTDQRTQESTTDTNQQPQQTVLQTTNVVNNSSIQPVNDEWERLFNSFPYYSTGAIGPERSDDDQLDEFLNSIGNNNSRQVMNVVNNSSNLGVSGNARATTYQPLLLSSQPEQNRSGEQGFQWLRPIVQQISFLQFLQTNRDRLQREFHEREFHEREFRQLLRRQIDGELVVHNQQLLQQEHMQQPLGIVNNGQIENGHLGVSGGARAMIVPNWYRPEVNNNEFSEDNISQLLNRPNVVMGEQLVMDEQQVSLPQQAEQQRLPSLLQNDLLRMQLQQLVVNNQRAYAQRSLNGNFMPRTGGRVDGFEVNNYQQPNSNVAVNVNSGSTVNSIMERVRNMIGNIVNYNGNFIRTENFWEGGYFTHRIGDRQNSVDNIRTVDGGSRGSMMNRIRAFFMSTININGGGGVGGLPYDGSY